MPNETIAQLILQSSRIVAAGKLDAYHPNNFGRLFLVGQGGAYEISLEEIGREPGEFNIALKLKEAAIPCSLDILEGALVVDGPFGILEWTDVFFIDERSGEICRRTDSFLVTAQHSEAMVKVDLNAVGTFLVEQLR